MQSRRDANGATAAELKALPNMPGFTLYEVKDRNHKPQTWGIMNGQRVEFREGLSHDKPKFVKAAKAPDVWRHGTLPQSTSRSTYKGVGTGSMEVGELPAWDALDRHVLRFYGFFKEAVTETNLENYRVRKVTILFYLEDDTCHIIEPRQDNSGLPQGTLIRRHRFPAPAGGYMKPENLEVGGDLQVYGRTVRITDCDPFTREYYRQLGMDQMEPQETEMDPFSATQEAIRTRAAVAPRTSDKLYREVMLGGGHINADMQQFLEHDRRVLRFYMVFDDLSTPQFERRPFTLCFFLGDDTVEIREQYPLNCGRDNFPVFFRRGKMALGAVCVEGPQSQPKNKSDYVHGHNLYVGQSVTLMGTNFYIYDADDFTREYFRDTLGVEMDPKREVQLPERAVPRAKTPPYTGYGSWADSMSSVMHLIPKQPKKDYNKLFNNDGKVLRFTARFVNPKPEDVDRLFVVNFHLFDDTLSIHEPPQRNLGIVTGRFLEKTVHMNQITGQVFKAEDLLPGQIIKVYNHEFEMLDMDEYTASTMSDPNKGRCAFNLVAVVEKIRESMRQQFPLVRDIFRRFDSDHDGVLTVTEFKKALEKFGFMLADTEVLTIMKHFDKRQDGQISYNEFCDTLLDEDYTLDMLKNKDPLDPEFDEHYANKALMKRTERVETTEVRNAARALGDVLYKRIGMMTRLCKELSFLTHLPTVSCQQIRHGLLQLGHSFDLEDVQRAVLFTMPDADLNAINYVEFFKSLQSAYHDLSCNR